MGTGIEWTEQTWNPVTGCSHASPGCDHCYAEELTHRLQAMGQAKYRDGFDRVVVHPAALEEPLRWRQPRLVFVNSMADLFHPEVPFDFIDQVFDVIRRTPRHTYQILTKRSKRMLAWYQRYGATLPGNTWLGVSIESQQYVYRAKNLAQIPAAVRFVSAEPLLAPLDLTEVLPDIDWVIVGGESGHYARPMDPEWARSIREQCSAAGVRFFLKQLGGTRRTGKRGGDEAILDGRLWHEYPTPRSA